MSHFKIHKDDLENNTVKTNRNYNTDGAKKPALREIQNLSEPYNPANLGKKDIVQGLIEKTKAVQIKNTDTFKHGSNNCNIRVPLRDVQKSAVGKDGNIPKEKSIQYPKSVDGSLVLDKEKTEIQLNKIKSNTPEVEKSLLNSSPRYHDIYGCEVYRDHIYRYLRKIEEQFMPKPFYLERQPEVTYMMRKVLVDWLVEVAEEYKLHNETLFRAVSFVDRFLSHMTVTKHGLQLLGTSAMFIAAKFEEIYPPEISDFVYITDNTYTIKEFIDMEHLILKALCFDLSSPTSHTFLESIAYQAKLPSTLQNLAMYICELTLLEGDPYLQFCPSLIACGAIALATQCWYKGFEDVWPRSLVNITGYTLEQLRPVIKHLNETHCKSTKQQTAIRKKYKTIEYGYVSLVASKRLILREPFVPSKNYH